MPSIVDLNILNQLSNGFGINRIQNIFELIITDLRGYLGIKPVDENVKIKVLSENSREMGKNFVILDLGVNRRRENNSLLIEIFEKKKDFLPFILLREAYYTFLPKEIKENKMVKVYINQIVENELEKAIGFRKWHDLIRDILVDREFLDTQSDRLQKFFKIETTEDHKTPVQFFFSEIHENTLIIGNRNIVNYYDELFEKYTYVTSKSLHNKDIIKTLIILHKIFVKNKKYINLKDYQKLYRKLLEEKELEPILSLNKFAENLQWINKCTSIAPSYNVVYNTVGLSPIFCELIFNPLIERKKVKSLLKAFPFSVSPRIIENSFSCKAMVSLILPTVYLKDILSYFNKLHATGYLISKRVYSYRAAKNLINLNYYSQISSTLKIIDPFEKSYKKEYELEHLIEFPFEPSQYHLSIFDYMILERIRYLSVTGLTFDKRIETLNAIKEDVKNEYRKQVSYIDDFNESFKDLLQSSQIREEFLLFIEQNKNQGLIFLRETLSSIINISDLIENILNDNPKIKNFNQFIIFLNENSISKILEENLMLKNNHVKKVIFNLILPKYFQSIKLYEKEIEKIKVYYKVINSCFNLKVLNLKAITTIVKNPKFITKINEAKVKRLKKTFKQLSSYKITNQKVESTLINFLAQNPPIIVPMLINTIITSQFAKYYPEIFLKNTPETRNKLEKFKSYFPRIFLIEALDLDSKEEILHILSYSVNIAEKGLFVSSLCNLFKEDLVMVRRNFWRGINRFYNIEPKDFYDFENKRFFYTKDFFEQFSIYTENLFNNIKLKHYKKKKISPDLNLFWASNFTIKRLVNIEKKRHSHQKISYISDHIHKLLEFRAEIEQVLLDQDLFNNVKISVFFNTYVKSIKFIPSFRKFGLAQYYLYLCPHDWNDIDLKLLFINTFQNIKHPAQIDQNQPVLIKTLFPYRTPNNSYINWLIKSKKAIRECCFFFIKKFYDITHFDYNLSRTGWIYSSNRFKIHIQNVLFNPHYSHQPINVREFNIDKHSKREAYGLDTPEFSELIQLYNRRSLDLKSYLGTNKYSIITTIYSLLKKQLIFPYIHLKNLGFQDKISIILPNVKDEIEDKIIKLFNFFNVCRIYEIEGDFYIYGFNEIQSFETGFMIEIWFPRCELDEFLDVFDLLFEYLEIKHYLILTDLVNGKTLIKNTYGSLKFLEEYNPLINLKWNKKDKIWMNHKLFTEKFEPIYPDMLYGIKIDKDNYNDKEYEDE